MTRSRRLIRILLPALTLLTASVTVAHDFERMLDTLIARFGQQSASSFRDWQKMMENAEKLSAPDKIKRINEFLNRRIRFGEDQQIWGQSDYWATPMETLGKGAGDCEDFAIIKYFTLLNLSIPDDQLRLIYVKARIPPEEKAAPSRKHIWYWLTIRLPTLIRLFWIV